MSVADRAISIICDQLSVSEEAVTPDANFANDMGADDVLLVELRWRFEEAFDIQIPDDDAEKLFSSPLSKVQDTINYLEGRLG